MATILRGKHKGAEVTIHQFCNDWFTVDGPEGSDISGEVIGPLSLQLDQDEVRRVLLACANGQTGTMFGEYDLDEVHGRFKRLRR